MAFDTWLAFVAASVALLVVPGPVILLAVTRSARSGFRAALPLAIGATLGDAFAMTLSLAGLGAVLSASAAAFGLLKAAGAAYLVWIGLRTLRDGGRTSRGADVPGSTPLREAFLVTALHPGGFVFFVAFVPLFVDAGRPVLAQMVILELTFLGLTAANVAAWATFGAVTRRQARGKWALGVLSKIGGTALIATGIGTGAAALIGRRS